MEKAKKKQVKRYISWGLLAGLVLFLAVMPLLAAQEEEADGPQASILSGTVQHGSVEASVRGGGNLAAKRVENVELPSGVKITEFLVKNGDTVTEGTPLAAIDRVTLMDAITQVQDTLEYLQEEMTDVKDDSVSSYIKATAGGRIKKVYAAEGETVQEVMLRDGALAILSLDGLMAATIERNSPLTTGETVCVILSDDTEVDGRVESNINGKVVITIDDEGYPIGETVTVTTEEGTRVGSGELYAHNAWTVTGFTGTIKTVQAEEEATVYSGANLFTLTDTDYTAQLEALAIQHREYEELLQDMIVMYREGAITAPCDGLVSGIDTDSAHLLSSQEQEWVPQLLTATPQQSYTIVLLSNVTEEEPSEEDMPSEEETEDTEQTIPTQPDTQVPDSWENVCTRDENCTAEKHRRGCPMRDNQEEDSTETAYTGYAAVVLTVDAESGITWVMKNPSSISVTDPANPPAIDSSAMTEVVSITGTTYTDGSAMAAGDTVLLLTEGGAIKLTVSSSGSGDDTQQETTPEQDSTKLPSGMGGMGGMGNATGGGAVQVPAFEPYPLEGTTLMTVTAQEEMTITITLDEQDIAKVQEGQAAQVRVSALRGQVFEGQVTEVGIRGTNSGGSSKFTVEITLPMGSDMLPGMTAAVTIPLYSKMDILTIPVAALVENATKTQVYTALDPETGEPAQPVTVTTGVSDGETVEILSGLNSGDSFYYSYYDTLEVSTEVERSMGFGR